MCYMVLLQNNYTLGLFRSKGQNIIRYFRPRKLENNIVTISIGNTHPLPGRGLKQRKYRQVDESVIQELVFKNETARHPQSKIRFFFGSPFKIPTITSVTFI